MTEAELDAKLDLLRNDIYGLCLKFEAETGYKVWGIEDHSGVGGPFPAGLNFSISESHSTDTVIKNSA
jgi:hypothetical protein